MGKLRDRGVHRLGRVGFVPESDPTRKIRVGEKQNLNRPVIMVGSSGSGPSGFGFHRHCRYFAGSVEIWARSRRDLARSRRI